jgi:hypothetical protein
MIGVKLFGTWHVINVEANFCEGTLCAVRCVLLAVCGFFFD